MLTTLVLNHSYYLRLPPEIVLIIDSSVYCFFMINVLSGTFQKIVNMLHDSFPQPETKSSHVLVIPSNNSKPKTFIL